MPTILIKKNDTASAVPGTANLTNLAGGAEIAVNTADRRLFTMNSSSAVVELGTNPSSITCSDVSATVLRAGSATITNLSASTLTISTGTTNSVGYLNGSKVFTTGSALKFDGANLGVGVTPSAWSGLVATQIGTSLGLASAPTGGTVASLLTNNLYYDGTDYRYINNGPAERYLQFNGIHTWSNAVSGTVGNVASLDSQMTLSAAGDLSLINGNLTLFSGTTDGVLYVNSSKVVTSGSAVTYNGATFATTGAANFATSSGNVGIGTSSPESKLAVKGASGDADLFSISDTTVPTSGAEYGVAMIKTNSTEYALNITGYNAASKGLRIYNNGQAAARTSFSVETFNGVSFVVDGVGNAGLGVTPSAWASPFKVIEGGDSNNQSWIGFQSNADAIKIGANCYYDGANYKYKNTAAAGFFNVQNNTFSFDQAASGTAGNNITFTTAMTLDASSNLTVAGAITSTRVNPRVSSTTTTSSLTPNIASFDQYNLTALAETVAINAPTGTPVDGNKLIFRILDNGTTRTLNWNGTYTAIGVTLPTATTANKMIYVGCIYNSANTRWDVIAVTTQA